MSNDGTRDETEKNPEADDFYGMWGSFDKIPVRYSERWKELRHWIAVLAPAAGVVVHIDPEAPGVAI